MLITRILTSAVVCALFGLSLMTTAHAERRVALVIGNSDYTAASPLASPKNDAELIAKALQSIGFEVKKLVNADQATLQQAIADFGQALHSADVSVFYYAGHAMQVKGRNYLIPVDAAIKGESDLDLKAIDTNRLLDLMKGATSKVNVVILDASRNNPFPSSAQSVPSGLADLNEPSGLYVAYSTAAGAAAEYGKAPDSPYAIALAKHLTKQGVEINDMFKLVSKDVIAATKGKQLPFETGTISGDFYFVPKQP